MNFGSLSAMSSESLSGKVIYWDPKEFAVKQNFNKVIKENEKVSNDYYWKSNPYYSIFRIFLLLASSCGLNHILYKVSQCVCFYDASFSDKYRWIYRTDIWDTLKGSYKVG